MTNNGSEKNNENICDVSYLTEMMHGKKHLIKEIIDEFLQQIPEELQCVNDAVKNANYSIIKNYAHSMKSSVSIMGITILTPILQEMEDLGTKAANIEKITELNHSLNLYCIQAIKEIEIIKHNYV